VTEAVVVKGPRPDRRRLAYIIAITADVVQFAFLPLFAFIIPAAVDDAIDVLVAIVMIRLLGWHPAFLPTLAAELVPGLNLLPTWTAAVWFVTRKKKAQVMAATQPPAEPPKQLP
jgi:hypothetical protein